MTSKSCFACPSEDAGQCIRLRCGWSDIEDHEDEYESERCECVCHREDDEDDE